jgi:F-type H+-transporting ATPase subunit beta
MPGRSVAVADTIAGCKAILAGECDDWQESSLYMVGTIDDARDKEKATRAAAPPAPPSGTGPAGAKHARHRQSKRMPRR